MSKKITVALLYGGQSSEHEVSLVSANSVFRNLPREKYRVLPIGIDKTGCCFLHEDTALLGLTTDALPVITPEAQALPSLIINGRFCVDADVVFPAMHGTFYEDGCLQGLLQLANIACVGCNVLSSAIGMDKDIQRRLAQLVGIPSTRYYSISKHQSKASLEAQCHTIFTALGAPVFVKPCNAGSSVGIHKAHTVEALMEHLLDAFRYDETALIEACIQGREIEVAVLENTNPSAPPHASMPGEICCHHPDGFYSYRAKYLETETLELIAPAQLNHQTVTTLQDMARRLFTALKCQGMARVDFFVDKENNAIYFNEVNTIPGFTPVSMYPKLWEISGMPYAVLLEKLIAIACQHQHHRQELVTNYQ